MRLGLRWTRVQLAHRCRPTPARLAAGPDGAATPGRRPRRARVTGPRRGDHPDGRSRAGVSSATAYNYFASRDHLFAELFCHHLERPAPARLTGTPTARLQQTTRHLAATIASAPALAAAATKSLLGSDPAVERLRVRIGTLSPTGSAPPSSGDGIDKRVLETLLLAFSGALLQTGMGLFTYPELADRLDDVVAVIMKGNA